MIDAISKRITSDDEGFTLIELLVVVIIIGILAAIAIPVFLNQRENAWERSVESDLRNAAIEFEGYYADEGQYPTGVSTDGTAGADEVDIVSSDGVESFSVTTDTERQQFCIQAEHENIEDSGNDTWAYSSTEGGLGDRGETCGTDGTF